MEAFAMNFTCFGLTIFDNCYRHFVSEGIKEDGRSSHDPIRARALQPAIGLLKSVAILLTSPAINQTLQRKQGRI